MKMIKVTSLDNYEAIINLDNVASIEQRSGGTRFYFLKLSHGDYFTAKESLNQIIELINNVIND